jgi:chromatin remodeling complex protein RSC6
MALTKKATAKKAKSKKVATTKATKRVATKVAAPKKAGKVVRRKASVAIARPLTPSGPLVVIVGSSPLRRTEVTSKIWAYIKKNKLQDAVNKRMINADDNLARLLGRKRKERKPGTGNDPGPSVSIDAVNKAVVKFLK